MTAVCVFCLPAAAVVCTQGIWRADWHRATVSQSLVHSPSLPQLWPLLRRFTRHDKGEGTVSSCVFACSHNRHLFFFNAFSSLCWHVCVSPLSGVLWYLAGVDGRAGTLLRPRHSWWQGTPPYFTDLMLLTVCLVVDKYIFDDALARLSKNVLNLISLQEVIFYKVIDYILHGKEDIKVIPWVNLFLWLCLNFYSKCRHVKKWDREGK